MKRWMEILLIRSQEAGKEGEVPVSAVILDKEGHCIGHGRNQRESTSNPLGHAELIALRQAAWIRDDWRFNDCTMIVTLEPCPMCAGALNQARMGQVIFAAKDKKRGALGGCIDLSNSKSSHHHMDVLGGIMQEEASKQISDWFKTRRS